MTLPGALCRRQHWRQIFPLSPLPAAGGDCGENPAARILWHGHSLFPLLCQCSYSSWCTGGGEAVRCLFPPTHSGQKNAMTQLRLGLPLCFTTACVVHARRTGPSYALLLPCVTTQAGPHNLPLGNKNRFLKGLTRHCSASYQYSTDTHVKWKVKENK